MTRALLSAALLLLLLPGAPAQVSSQTSFTIVVSNSVTNAGNKTFSTFVSFRGILLGGMRRLQDKDSGFTFKYTEDDNYGPFLESVNGLAGCPNHRTYWELKVKKPDNKVILPDVGIGCYIPSAGDVVILNFNKY
ncbi:cobalamin binding intrinsic factor-like [Clinocottus analis]|uniref:cobalamin binding intrinsic factor-like n=1 Tax=Clinocottus analis TaxID=304258 RepID=UPI0035BFF84D